MADTMADTKMKAERKKPVRKGPKRSAFKTEVEYLEARLAYQKAEDEKVNEGRIARLDKRIASKTDALAKLSAEIDNLKAERAELVGDEVDGNGLTEEDHLVLEGKV